MEIARTLESNYKEMSFAPEIIVKEKMGVDLELEKLDASEEENELISNGHDVNIEETEEAEVIFRMAAFFAYSKMQKYICLYYM